MPDLLLQLRDIHTQNDIGWELAWGWWLVVLLAIILLTILIFYVIKVKHNKRLKNQVKALLEDALNDNNPAIKCLLVLRSYAHFRYPNSAIKTLNEKQWQDFLQEKLPFNKELTLLFSQTMYQTTANVNKQALLSYCQKWVDCV